MISWERSFRTVTLSNQAEMGLKESNGVPGTFVSTIAECRSRTSTSCLIVTSLRARGGRSRRMTELGDLKFGSTLHASSPSSRMVNACLLWSCSSISTQHNRLTIDSKSSLPPELFSMTTLTLRIHYSRRRPEGRWPHRHIARHQWCVPLCNRSPRSFVLSYTEFIFRSYPLFIIPSWLILASRKKSSTLLAILLRMSATQIFEKFNSLCCIPFM